MNVRTIMLAILVASLFAFIGVSVNSELATTYSVTMSDNTTTRYEAIQEEAQNVAEDINQTQEWLQDLTEGDIGGFVFAMPANVANILGLFLQLPNIAYSVFDSTLAIFGIPSFVSGIIAVMLIVTVVLLIASIWTEGRL